MTEAHSNSQERTAYLLVLGEREAISWVLNNQRMAFPSTPRREVAALKQGDELFLLTTRGAFHNPTIDRTRVIGQADVESPPRHLDRPIEIAGREFVSECNIKILGLAPRQAGVEIAPLAPVLETFKNRAAWGMLLRRPLLELTRSDASLLARELEPHIQDYVDTVSTYAIDPLDKHAPRPRATQARRGHVFSAIVR